MASGQPGNSAVHGSRLGGELRRRRDTLLKTPLAEALEGQPRRAGKANISGPWVVVPVAAASMLALAAVAFLW